jgi:hypothetical protein
VGQGTHVSHARAGRGRRGRRRRSGRRWRGASSSSWSGRSGARVELALGRRERIRPAWTHGDAQEEDVAQVQVLAVRAELDLHASPVGKSWVARETATSGRPPPLAGVRSTPTGRKPVSDQCVGLATRSASSEDRVTDAGARGWRGRHAVDAFSAITGSARCLEFQIGGYGSSGLIGRADSVRTWSTAGRWGCVFLARRAQRCRGRRQGGRKEGRKYINPVRSR